VFDKKLSGDKSMKSPFSTFSIAIILLAAILASLAPASSQIFPAPKDIKRADGDFIFTEKTKILLSPNPSDFDLFLARLLVAELSDFYFMPVLMDRTEKISNEKSYILMGTFENPLIKKYIKTENMNDIEGLGNEGYFIKISQNAAIIAANTNKGVFYGFQSLRQLIQKENKHLKVPGIIIKDKPSLPFRGIRLYVPGPENIPFFKRFVRDFMALYKFNKVILEMNGVMRLDRHPEINVGAIEFANEMNYSRRDRPAGPGNQYQDSAHHDAGDGQILEKKEVANLVEYIRQFHIEVVPEIPSLTHVYYLLNRHKELAEITKAEWPDTYCPSKPESYELLFDVYDEYIEVIQPDMIHIGKDEWRMPVHVCPLCKDKDYKELFVQDVNKIYDYLNSKGVKVGMWGDHFLESVREQGFRDCETKSGYKYQVPGAITPQQVQKLIPKDILIFNWFWGEKENDLAVEDFGFKQVYGNFRPNISGWKTRSEMESVLGGAPSSWAGTTELNFGKDLLYDFLGSANLLWAGESLGHGELSTSVRQLLPKVRHYLSGKSLPSLDNKKISPIDISSFSNVNAKKSILNVTLKNMKKSETGNPAFKNLYPGSNNKPVAIGVATDNTVGLPTKVLNIKIDKDVSSLIFLHACAKEAGNEKAYRRIYNFDDTSDLLGWYEIVYEDGFVESIPIRYGINILDVNMRKRDSDKWEEGKTGAPQNVYAYLADPIEYHQDGATKTFFAYEWKNPRFGKVIKSVNLKASKLYKNYAEKNIPPNAIFLLGLNYVEKRPIPDASINSGVQQKSISD
jgi:hypothetical protein